MRILFVDDEPALLRGVERMLYDRQGEWRMVFAESGEKALEIMDREEFDVIVADMRMPGMDGAELLREVRKRRPGVVRIVLSGHSDRDIVMRAVRPAHQFLSKPCKGEELVRTIQQAFDLRLIFTDPMIREVITRIDTLPVMPAVHAQLMDALKDESRSLADLGEIVSRDVGLASGVLKIVNSSFFGLRQGVSTPAQAVIYLGVDILRALILYNGVFSTLNPARRLPFSLESLWAHSLRTARFAAGIAGREKAEKKQADQCFVAGLLHDVGKLVLIEGLGSEYGEAVALSRERNMPIVEAEKERLGVTHAEVGGYLLGLWGFAPGLVNIVASHHEPGREPLRPLGALAYVHAANVLEHELVVLHSGYAPRAVDQEFSVGAGFAEKLGEWREFCAGMLQEAAGHE